MSDHPIDAAWLEEVMKWRASHPQKSRRDVPRHGLTRLQAAVIRASVGYCEICGATDDLVVDHDPAADSLWGVLCSPCNRKLDERWRDPEVIRAILRYLQKPPDQRPPRP